MAGRAFPPAKLYFAVTYSVRVFSSVLVTLPNVMSGITLASGPVYCSWIVTLSPEREFEVCEDPSAFASESRTAVSFIPFAPVTRIVTEVAGSIIGIPP